MKADALRELAIAWLRDRYPTALIVPEMSIGKWGKAMLDVAAIVPPEPDRYLPRFRSNDPRQGLGHIAAIEIKGEGDSPSRMALQGAAYSKAAQQMWILPCPSLEAKIFRHAPDEWEKLGIREGAVVPLKPNYAARHDKSAPQEPWIPTGHPDAPGWLCTAPAQLLQAMWKDDLLMIARIHNLQPSRKMTVDDLTREISENVPLAEIRTAVIARLLERDYGTKLVYRPEDGD